MRWPIEVILDMLTSGMTIETILQDHPELEREDILASLSFAKASLIGYSSKNTTTHSYQQLSI